MRTVYRFAQPEPAAPRTRNHALGTTSRDVTPGGDPMTKYVIRRIVQAIPVLYRDHHRRLRHPARRAGRPDRTVRQEPAHHRPSSGSTFMRGLGPRPAVPVQYCRWMGFCNPRTNDGHFLGIFPEPGRPASAPPAGPTSCRARSAAPATASSTATSASRSTRAKVSDHDRPGGPADDDPGRLRARHLDRASRSSSASTRPSNAIRSSTRRRRSSPTSASPCPRSGWGSC